MVFRSINLSNHSWPAVAKSDENPRQWASITMKGHMKQFTIEVKHASGPQLQTIAAELKIMSHDWTKFGPRITINKRALEPLKLKQSVAEARKERATYKRHN